VLSTIQLFAVERNKKLFHRKRVIAAVILYALRVRQAFNSGGFVMCGPALGKHKLRFISTFSEI